MKLSHLISKDPISHFFIFPLLHCKTPLKDRGFNLNFFTSIQASLFDCDILLLDNRFFSSLWAKEAQKAFGLLEEIRKRVGRVIWLDVTDSTGATQFQVLPYVDRYWKKQLLKDRSLYMREFYGARIYSEYYKNRFDLPSEEAFRCQPIDPKYLSKLDLSWNLALAPYHRFGLLNSLAHRLPLWLREMCFLKSDIVFSPWGERNIDLGFRGSDRYNSKALGFQRIETKRILARRGVDTSPVPRWKYLNELFQTKIGVSPFGAGEICFRDFEIIQAGGVLLKPDMSHCETWPDLFIENETYVPFRWDFSDFHEVIDGLLRDQEKIKGIAQTAQKRYQYFLSDSGKEEFCQRFIDQVKPQ